MRSNQIHLKRTEDTDVLGLKKSEIRVFSKISFYYMILLHRRECFTTGTKTLRTRYDV